ncbi:PHB depolymerase family esterase [Streptomyces sp. DG2A-72]|uniref:PHB depolymerase family esterase n=1 Tax=Streptomyces sp. DG2A-72 TaxID=3051386 RepID=UPI00265C3697|nr:PHB depolymerase family esterase [Streptomyces sp. DG2A-72]MDO0933593.1 PHB depolymerase family esterase [Streptomyces sp. DG2A-72]
MFRYVPDGLPAVMMAAYPEKLAAGGIVAGLPYGCAQAAGSPYVCMYVGATQTPSRWGDRVRAARPGYTAVAGYPHQVFRDTSGNTAVETYSITAWVTDILDVDLCAAYRMGRA